MRITDSHVNITENGKWLNPKFDASFDRLLEEMVETGVEKAVLISLPNTNSNSFISSVITRYPNKFKGLGSLDFSKDLIKQVEELIILGFSGIKIHPRIQGINICDEKYDYLWEYFNKKKLVVLIDGFYQLTNTDVKISELLPLSYEKTISKYKNVTIILAHAGFHRVMDTFFLCKSYPNFYTNISYSINLIEELSLYQDYKFLLKNCDRKVLFGSDFPEINLKNALKPFKKLVESFQNDKIENMLYLNAEKIFWNKS